jgi:hypothetical protein
VFLVLIPARLETQLGTGCASVYRSPLIPTYIYSARFSAHMYKKTPSLSILFRCFDYIPDPNPHYPTTPLDDLHSTHLYIYPSYCVHHHHHHFSSTMPTAVISNATRIWELNVSWPLFAQCGVWDPKGRGVDIWECIRARTCQNRPYFSCNHH